MPGGSGNGMWRNVAERGGRHGEEGGDWTGLGRPVLAGWDRYVWVVQDEARQERSGR